MKKLLVGILLALLLGLGIGYAVRANRDTFFNRCLHAYGYDGQPNAASRMRVEQMCLKREMRKGDRR